MEDLGATGPGRWRDRRVLVTGATGLIGAHLVRHLLDAEAQVICLVRDHDPASPLWSTGDAARVAIADGRLQHFEDVKTAILERAVDTIFHLGAQTIVGVARIDPLGTFEANIRGTYHLLEACRLYGEGVRRIVIASSDKAYGHSNVLPYTETMPLAARNPYDVSKCCADLLAQSYHATYGLPIAIARCGNVYGPGDLNFSRLVPGTIRSLLRGERPVIRSDGSPRREYLHVDDAVAAYLALARWLDDDDTQEGGESARAFNFGTGEPLTVLDVVRRLGQATDREDLTPLIVDCARAEIADQSLDFSRARRLLRWAPQVPLDDGLRATIAWYRQRLRRPAAPVAIETAAPQKVVRS